MTFSGLGCRISFGRFAIIGSEGQGTSKGVMENLRRKERDTSSKTSEAGTLAVRIKPCLALLRGDVVARRRLIYRLRDVLHSHRLIPISAPPDRLE
jgi:hypothetical protein